MRYIITLTLGVVLLIVFDLSAEEPVSFKAGTSFSISLKSDIRAVIGSEPSPAIFLIDIPGANLKEARLVVEARGEDKSCRVYFSPLSIQLRFPDRTKANIPIKGRVASADGSRGLQGILMTDLDCQSVGCIPVKGCVVSEQALARAGGKGAARQNWYVRLFEKREAVLTIEEDMNLSLKAKQ